MFIFKIIGIIIALAMAGAAILAIIYSSVVWAVIWGIGAITVGTISLVKRKKADTK